MYNGRFIELNKDLKPKFDTLTYTTNINIENLGLALVKPYVVIEIEKEKALEFFQLIQDLDIKTNAIRTETHYQFWFKCKEKIESRTKLKSDEFGIEYNIKTWFSNDYVVLRKDNEEYNWIETPNDDSNALSDLPIPFKPEQDGKSKAKKIRTEDIAQTIIDKHKFYIDEDDNMYVFFDGRYRLYFENYALETLIFKENPTLSVTQMKEIIFKVKLLLNVDKHNYSNIKPLGIHEVAFNNCIVDLYTLQTRELTSDDFFYKQIPHDFDIDQQVVSVVDKTLKKLTLNDSELEQLLLEMLAYCICNHNKLDAYFILLGSGSNGKSVFLTMIREVFGAKNCSAIPFSKFHDSNALYQMVGKSVNLVDDMGTKVQDSDTFKSIVSGQPITVKKLYSDYISANISSKIIAATNSLPKLKDTSQGVERRTHIIPFDARFSKDDEDYDPNIQEKLLDEKSIKYFILKAIKTYKDLWDRKDFVKPERSLLEKVNYMAEVKTIFKWLESNYRLLMDKDIRVCYNNYANWCDNFGVKGRYSILEFETIINKDSSFIFKSIIRDNKEVKVLSERILTLIPFFEYDNLKQYVGLPRTDLYNIYMNSEYYLTNSFSELEFVSYINATEFFEINPIYYKGKMVRGLKEKKL